MDTVCGVVVCGGESKRMGVDKAGLALAGKTLLERALARLDPLCSRVVLACGARARYAELGRDLVLDAAVGEGPAAGILGALEAFDAERFLVLPCDMPRVGESLLAALLERAQRDDLDACFFESARGIEPLCAAYHRRVGPAMRRALAGGEGRVLAFLDHARADGSPVRAGFVKESELEPELSRCDPAHNLNTPAELARERALWGEEVVA